MLFSNINRRLQLNLALSLVGLRLNFYNHLGSLTHSRH